MDDLRDQDSYSAYPAYVVQWDHNSEKKRIAILEQRVRDLEGKIQRHIEQLFGVQGHGLGK